MGKFLITATKVINYETEVEANDMFHAYEVVGDLIVDDFTQVGTEFTIDYVSEG